MSRPKHIYRKTKRLFQQRKTEENVKNRLPASLFDIIAYGLEGDIKRVRDYTEVLVLQLEHHTSPEHRADARALRYLLSGEYLRGKTIASEYFPPACLVGLTDVEPAVLVYAEQWLQALSMEVRQANLTWLEPLVNVVEGEIMFEWWHDTRKMTIMLPGSEGMIVWGEHPTSPITEIRMLTREERHSAWIWLMTGIPTAEERHVTHTEITHLAEALEHGE